MLFPSTASDSKISSQWGIYAVKGILMTHFKRREIYSFGSQVAIFRLYTRCTCNALETVVLLFAIIKISDIVGRVQSLKIKRHNLITADLHRMALVMWCSRGTERPIYSKHAHSLQ